MVFDFGIAGYRPDWLNGVDATASRHGHRLRALVGRRVTATWVVWDADDDEWFNDGPVLLDFGGDRFEINHQKFDDLSITWNSIDVTRPPVWPTEDGFNLAWRNDAPPALADRHGHAPTAVELLEWAGGDLADGSVAVGMRFDDGWLTIYNALDENGIGFSGDLDPSWLSGGKR